MSQNETPNYDPRFTPDDKLEIHLSSYRSSLFLADDNLPHPTPEIVSRVNQRLQTAYRLLSTTSHGEYPADKWQDHTQAEAYLEHIAGLFSDENRVKNFVVSTKTGMDVVLRAEAENKYLRPHFNRYRAYVDRIAAFIKDVEPQNNFLAMVLNVDPDLLIAASDAINPETKQLYFDSKRKLIAAQLALMPNAMVDLFLLHFEGFLPHINLAEEITTPAEVLKSPILSAPFKLLIKISESIVIDGDLATALQQHSDSDLRQILSFMNTGNIRSSFIIHLSNAVLALESFHNCVLISELIPEHTESTNKVTILHLLKTQFQQARANSSVAKRTRVLKLIIDQIGRLEYNYYSKNDRNGGFDLRMLIKDELKRRQFKDPLDDEF